MELSILCCPATAEAKTISNFTLSHFQSITDINELYWNKFIPAANFLMQYDYLRLIESTHGDQMQFRYVLVEQNGTTIGAIYFQVVKFEGAQLINYFPQGNSGFMKLAKAGTKRFLDSIHLKMLVSGNTFMTGENGFYFSHDTDKATRAKILRRAISEVLQRDTSIKAALISDLYSPKTEFDHGFPIHGFNQIYVESDMSIQIRHDWNTFHDYVDAMTSKYRVRTKRVYALCRQAGIIRKDLNAEEVALHQDELHNLYMKVMEQADFKLAVLSKDYFRLQKQQLPENYHVYAYYKEGKMIGFISAFQFGKKVEVHYTGMEHEIAKPLHLYQHMMYDMVELAINLKAEKLHFGRTAPEIKSTIGATPSPMYGYLKHRNPAFNYLVMKPYARSLKPKKYELRNPFKS